MSTPKFGFILGLVVLIESLNFVWGVNLAANHHEDLQSTSSVSHFYDSRSLFANPSALGYQTQLNGGGVRGSFSYATNRVTADEFDTALTIGNFGLGVERLSATEGLYTRFSLGMGMPFLSKQYLGIRYRFTRSEIDSLTRFNTFDLGWQFHPFSFLSVGLLASTLNQPEQAGAIIPSKYTFGLAVQPFSPLLLLADFSTYSKDFGNPLHYQFVARIEPLPGLFWSVGYHDERKWQVGVQFSIGNSTLYGVSHPNSADKNLIIGAQFSPVPYRSTLTPSGALHLEIDGSLTEEIESGSLFITQRPSFVETLKNLHLAKTNPRIRAIFLRLEKFPLGLASAVEFGNILKEIRDTGKSVHVSLSNTTLREYLIAACADSISVEPQAEFRFLGFRAERYFVKGTLEKLGVDAELLAQGEYKSAPEMFTRRESSSASRESTLEELRLAEKLSLEHLKKCGRLQPPLWKSIQELALFGPEEAKKMGLVDQIEPYASTLERLQKKYFLSDNALDRSERLALPAKIAVVVASGDILQNPVPLLSLRDRGQITPERVERQLRKATADAETRALIIRVSSPGGEILASQQIASAIQKAREKFPVYISMADVAASGGYMMAAPATRIFASPLTLTGSIGVFLGKVNLGNLYKKIDLHKEILTLAPFAGILSEDRAWTSAERSIMLKRLHYYYDHFVATVAQARKLSPADAEKAAKGRVWLGTTAQELRLVDELGGTLDAVNYALRDLRLSPGDAEIWPVEKVRGLFAFSPAETFAQSTIEWVPTTLLGENLLKQVFWMSRLKENPFLALSMVQITDREE